MMMMMMMVFIRAMITLLIIMMMFSGAINLFVQSISTTVCHRGQPAALQYRTCPAITLVIVARSPFESRTNACSSCCARLPHHLFFLSPIGHFQSPLQLETKVAAANHVRGDVHSSACVCLSCRV